MEPYLKARGEGEASFVLNCGVDGRVSWFGVAARSSLLRKRLRSSLLSFETKLDRASRDGEGPSSRSKICLIVAGLNDLPRLGRKRGADFLM